VIGAATFAYGLADENSPYSSSAERSEAYDRVYEVTNWASFLIEFHMDICNLNRKVEQDRSRAGPHVRTLDNPFSTSIQKMEEGQVPNRRDQKAL
jgi:hypothetical protein